MSDIIERLRIMDAEQDSSFLRLDAIDEIQRLRSRLAAAETDAKRYRWLRDSATTGDWCELGGMTAERMEADIDAHLSAAPAGWGPRCERCGDSGWIDGDPVAGIADEPCGHDDMPADQPTVSNK